MANWFSELLGDKKNAAPVQNQPPIPSWLAQRYEAIKDQPPAEPYRYNTDQLDQWAHPDAQWAMTHDPRVNPAFVLTYPNAAPFTPDNLSPEQRAEYQENVDKISTNPLAMLGANPSKTNITSNNGGSLSGFFDDETGKIYLKPLMRSQVHESMHSGLQQLRNLGDASVFEKYLEKPIPKIKNNPTQAEARALRSYNADAGAQHHNEEMLVRSIMQKRGGGVCFRRP